VARLAQTSISFRRIDIDEQRLRELGPQIDDAAARIAHEIYWPGVELDVVLEAGSLLVRATVIGGLLLGGYNVVSKYKDFKEGIVELVKDAHEYGSGIYNEVLKLTGQQNADTVTIRDMTPGRIVRVIQKLEKVRELQKEKAPDWMVQKELQRIARDVQAIEQELAPEEKRLIDRELELKGLPPLERLPKPGLVHEDRSAILRQEERQKIGHVPAPSGREKRKRLRYHNHFVVGSPDGAGQTGRVVTAEPRNCRTHEKLARVGAC